MRADAKEAEQTKQRDNGESGDDRGKTEPAERRIILEPVHEREPAAGATVRQRRLQKPGATTKQNCVRGAGLMPCPQT